MEMSWGEIFEPTYADDMLITFGPGKTCQGFWFAEIIHCCITLVMQYQQSLYRPFDSGNCNDIWEM